MVLVLRVLQTSVDPSEDQYPVTRGVTRGGRQYSRGPGEDVLPKRVQTSGRDPVLVLSPAQDVDESLGVQGKRPTVVRVEGRRKEERDSGTRGVSTEMTHVRKHFQYH